MPLFDFKCKKCGNNFESIEKTDVDFSICPKCSYIAKKIFPRKSPSFNLSYNPKKDICDWSGNTSQYYRLYNEAKSRGEKVRLPEKGE